MTKKKMKTVIKELSNKIAEIEKRLSMPVRDGHPIWEPIGKPVSRKEALEIVDGILKTAESERKIKPIAEYGFEINEEEGTT
jgi:hypothetical protein